MKNLFLSLAFMLVSRFSFASSGEVKDVVLESSEDVLKEMPFTILTSCGVSISGEGDFTVDEFFDLMDTADALFCGIW
jgi:hypothetical protein